jgi:outer membrane receptor for ferrienterochelin and colicins
MSMQGISGENVKILIDGVPVLGRLDGNIDLSKINLNMLTKLR